MARAGGAMNDWVLDCDSGDRVGVAVPLWPDADARIIVSLDDADRLTTSAVALTGAEALDLGSRLIAAAADLAAGIHHPGPDRSIGSL